MVIKAQVLADFIAEFTHDIALEPEKTLPVVENIEKKNQHDDLIK